MNIGYEKRGFYQFICILPRRAQLAIDPRKLKRKVILNEILTYIISYILSINMPYLG